MTLIEKIIANHSKFDTVKPGDIVDIDIDTRAARDFGGANVVKNLKDFKLPIDDPTRTFFTFDCNPTGSDQKYAVNQHICRLFAREHGIKVYDIDKGIGTHAMIQEGLAWPGSTAVTTDSHANILGAIGSFGQGMGDQDIAAAWSKGKVWFKVPPSVKINLNGEWPEEVRAKDIALNLLNQFGANDLLGYSAEIYGEAVNRFTLDERITIASMATEMGCIIILFEPNQWVMDYCEERTGRKLEPIKAGPDAHYEKVFDINLEDFAPRVSLPGAPHDTVPVTQVKGKKIDSAFIGSCTNGRIQDMRMAASILEGRQVAPGVVLKIVPATDEVWQQCLEEGLVQIFKNAGALLSNAGCAGCAAGQVGQNGPGEVTISTGNRNFPGKQGKGEVYLASPAVVAASAVAGMITTPDDIPDEPAFFPEPVLKSNSTTNLVSTKRIDEKPTRVKGRVWYIKEDNIDTDMIFHNRYLAITDIKEMGQYAFDNLKGHENFAKQAKPGDIVVVQKNFGSGSSRQQAVDCFISLGIGAILAESYGAIYERNAINAAFPIVTYLTLDGLDLKDGDTLEVDFISGEIVNTKNQKKIQGEPFSEVQLEIYQNGGLF
ncbi:MAG TPA: homoaconitate hydratase [Marinilabiliales bacterium]|nr:MAG: homoaconitate hydratase [Bacteroidetes bacterium GWA2_40_14]OFX57065.1 MAG: homoaconitate hydratase [Bacteroidetes bacterium GWC2_40_13]OFX94257.1 MAG: homoaconitate hydratase [Bacteroidetes bacterium GWE2_40_63]OFY23674.1 MAG: homoaconitate hydratase [Bacteroidetes bacterium GWF2_40_13]OFZ25251.1 MAG: homoaconitate hydratase [Bacteroidetes bacterium RIFOXYC2_FULL_40_12]HAM99312.1 homoaconitate hydratase [Marinilabiliales bacterium]